MKKSSGDRGVERGFDVVGVVAQHGPDDVDAATREGDQSLLV